MMTGGPSLKEKRGREMAGANTRLVILSDILSDIFSDMTYSLQEHICLSA